MVSWLITIGTSAYRLGLIVTFFRRFKGVHCMLHCTELISILYFTKKIQNSRGEKRGIEH